MRHGIDEQSWLAWLDGTLDAQARSALEAHLGICADCGWQSRQLERWRELLETEAGRLRAALCGGEEEWERMAWRSLHRLREAAARQGLGRWTVLEALSILRLLMEPICGQGTVRAVVERALERSRAAGPALTWGDWGRFVGHLSDAAASVCGSAVGRLVALAGLCLAEEAVA
ncbi:MAG: zf-HC2 domain-containing protein [Bryobacterales bacterium]|nr:zf-HC2 domain-containing protein [Bryobacteraceae bacterium]MDW8353846.1 zf-HC2 domain-containing protein [Bryobacterales bacterium]